MSTQTLIALTPVVDGRLEALRAAVRELPRDDESPFARVFGTHVARFVVIDALDDRDLAPDPGSGSYLLFSTDHEGDVAVHVERLRNGLGQHADDVWGHCAGYPGVRRAEPFRDWVLAHRVPAGFSVQPYRHASVDDVRTALGLRRRLVEFELASGDLAPAALKAAWLAEFGDGRGGIR